MRQLAAGVPHASHAANTHGQAVLVRRLGIAEYEPTWRAMQSFTAARTAATADEIWLLQHPPVYTLGVAGRAVHLPRNASAVPIVRIDRGGQITYHGPGQLVAYLLLDMKRRGLAVRPLVRCMEQAVIDLLAEYGISAAGRVEAPGVYVGQAKIAAVGLRITRGCSYHGLALNVDMDLSPFHAIDPCGYPGLAVTQLSDLGVAETTEHAGEKLARHLSRLLA
ncbi:MAG TPA: lipoyl(octanoyl) transferase LipB [Burkholderiales bacterium]|nr:lipoyl(octanoyl) transferase LipB [Burkholderiales bacterium]